MILEFKTARNKTNGSRRYLAIDTRERVRVYSVDVVRG